jgi:hypothetical protein
MHGEYSTHGTDEKCIQNFGWENIKEETTSKKCI